MDLFLVRHAEAVDRAAGISDERRALTARGRRHFAKCVRGLGRLGLRFDVLVHSPLLRAMETAELCVPLLDGETRVSMRLVQPPDEALLTELTGGRVAIVGHEPYLSELLTLATIGWRVLGDSEERAPFAFEKGGVAWLRGEPRVGGMQQVAFLPPRVLRAL
jgi:phosphohistidine phosphatase